MCHPKFDLSANGFAVAYFTDKMVFIFINRYKINSEIWVSSQTCLFKNGGYIIYTFISAY